MSGANHNHLIPLSENVEENIKKLEMALGKSDDLSIRRLNVSAKNVAIIHIEGIVDDQSINENVLSPIIQLNKENHPFKSTKELADKMVQILSVASIEFIFNWSEFLENILAGDTVILVDDSPKAITLGTKKIQSRSITEPTTQTVIKGPKDSFTENISTNISLVRSRIQNAKLRLKLIKVGNVTKTDVGIMYIQGNADNSIVDEVMSRLEKINIDSILEANYIEEALRDNRKTLFPLMQSSERPDVVAANLLEGKVVIIIQGTPFVLILPVLLIQFFQSPEDYYENNAFSSFLRLIRIGSFLLNMYASAVYLALITHHQGLIPTTLMVTLMAQRERVPFPAIIELLLMELAFEVLREAGVRMPRAIGPAVSIVGALILGQAAVEAGFVSAAIVIIVATSAINSFTLPNTNIVNTARGLRFLLILCSAFIGFYGILLCTLCILVHLCSLRSFGVPYVAPFAPFRMGALKDSIIRFPITSLNMHDTEGNKESKTK